MQAGRPGEVSVCGIRVENRETQGNENTQQEGRAKGRETKKYDKD